MKKLCFISLVCAAMMFVSCGKKTATALESSIPKDAMLVARIDIKNLITKADYNLSENQILEEFLTEFDDVGIKNFNNFIKNSNSFGIDVLDTAYLFTDGKVIGLLMSVNNAKKIYKNLKTGNAYEIKKEKGVYSATNDSESIVWDNNKFMLLVNEEEDIENEINFAEYFNLPAEKSIVSDINFQKFMLSKSDVSVYISYSNFGNLAIQNRHYFKINENYEGISALAELDFENGKIVARSKYLYETAEIENIMEKNRSARELISGEFLKYVSQKPLILFVINHNEKKMSYYVKNDIFNLLLDKAQYFFGDDVDLKKEFISNIKGDVVVALNNIDYDGFSISFFAKLSNANAVKSFIKKVNRAGMFNMGVKDDYFYFLSNNHAKKLFAKGAENNLLKNCKEQPIFIYGDWSNLKASLPFIYEEYPVVQMFAPTIEKGVLLIENFESEFTKDNAEFTINFTDKTQNSLKQIFQLVMSN